MTPEAPLATMLACVQCRRMLPQSELVQIAGNWVCGECKAGYLSRVVAGDTSGSAALRYAGVGIRFGARFVDGLVYIVPFMVLALVFLPTFIQNPARNILQFEAVIIGISLLFSLIYEVLMLRFWGATLGKMACGVRVVRADGSGLGWGVSFGRYFMYNVVISALPFVNYILLITTAVMAGVDNEHRGLHDRVCDTRVIHTR